MYCIYSNAGGTLPINAGNSIYMTQKIKREPLEDRGNREHIEEAKGLRAEGREVEGL